jgi:hypothetical protein
LFLTLGRREKISARRSSKCIDRRRADSAVLPGNRAPAVLVLPREGGFPPLALVPFRELLQTAYVANSRISGRRAPEIIGTGMRRALGQNPGIWLCRRQSRFLVRFKPFIRNSSIRRRYRDGRLERRFFLPGALRPRIASRVKTSKRLAHQAEPHHWSVFESLQLFGLLSQRNCLSNVQKSSTFNHHPACVFGLRCTGYNFAETVQIEIEDLVIALPS